jgi:cysteinyl-tRNA synthetase
MSLRVYNSLSQKEEEFVPLTAGKVSMYVCGITVYDECHLGHARAAVVFDIIYRCLKQDYDVIYVRNFTDVDDKIIKRAQENNEDWKNLSERYIESYHDEMDRLRVLRPTHEPRATQHIPEMISLIQNLEEKELAYSKDGDVFYAVKKFKGYGKLSHKKIDELEIGARIAVDERKIDPLDFALWKKAKEGEPFWPSPWAEGRPGWHIECSAMSMKYFGESFDIHGGGRDLIFPHHENEIAQSEGSTGVEPFAKYWLHNGFVNIDSEKMSKSEGNFLTVHNILKEWDPEVVRYFLLSAHYRSPLDFTEDNMGNAHAALIRYYKTMQRLHEAPAGTGSLDTDLKKMCTDAMSNDFNTPQLIGDVFKLVREINTHIDHEKSWSPENKKKIIDGLALIGEVLGILDSDPMDFQERVKKIGLESTEMLESEIEEMLQKRREARAAKDWKKADAIRDEMIIRGVSIKDNPDGTTSWTIEK